MLKTFKTVCIAALLITAYSCKKDNDDEVSTDSSAAAASTGETQVDVTNASDLTIVTPTFSQLDGSEVASKISIDGATTKSGTPPAPTEGYSAPTISDYSYSSENQRVRNDHSMNLAINGYNLDDVEGVYLQVDGSSEYFDVPVTVNDNDNSYYRLRNSNQPTNALGRSKKATVESTNNIDLQIEIPSSITQGTFCVSYCLYTADGQIGNVVTRCIDVQEFGSTSVDFLGGWDFTKAVANIEGEVETIEKGKPNNWFDDEEGNSCGEEEGNIIDHLILTFASNGGIKMDEKYTNSYFTELEEGTWDDNYNYTQGGEPICSSFTTETDEYVENGAWTYNAATETLTIIFDGEENLYDPYFIDFKLVQSGSDMSLVLDFADEGEDFNIVYDFVKK